MRIKRAFEIGNEAKTKGKLNNNFSLANIMFALIFQEMLSRRAGSMSLGVTTTSLQSPRNNPYSINAVFVDSDFRSCFVENHFDLLVLELRKRDSQEFLDALVAPVPVLEGRSVVTAMKRATIIHRKDEGTSRLYTEPERDDSTCTIKDLWGEVRRDIEETELQIFSRLHLTSCVYSGLTWGC